MVTIREARWRGGPWQPAGCHAWVARETRGGFRPGSRWGAACGWPRRRARVSGGVGREGGMRRQGAAQMGATDEHGGCGESRSSDKEAHSRERLKEPT